MRKKFILGVTAALLAGLGGCESRREQIRPPLAKEEVVEPPHNDARYDGPPVYPKGTLTTNPIRRRTDPPAQDGTMPAGYMK